MRSFKEVVADIERTGFKSEAGPLEQCREWIDLKEFLGLLSQQFDIEDATKVLAGDIWDALHLPGGVESIDGKKIRELILVRLAAAVKVAQHGQQPMFAMIKILRHTVQVLMDARTVAQWVNGQFMIANPSLPPCVLTTDFIMKEIPFINLPAMMQKVAGANTEAVVTKKVPANG